MLEPADQALHLACTYLGSGKLYRNPSSECGLRSSKPDAGSLTVTLEQLHRTTEYARCPHQAIGLLGRKSAFSLPTGESSGRNLNQLGDGGCRETGVSLETGEGRVPQPLSHLTIQRERPVGAEPEKGHVEVPLGAP